MRKLVCFRSDDVGAVTVDFLAIVAASLLLGLIVVYSIFNSGVASLATSISNTLSGVSTPTSDDSVVSFSDQDEEDGDDGDGHDDDEGDDQDSGDGDDHDGEGDDGEGHDGSEGDDEDNENHS